MSIAVAVAGEPHSGKSVFLALLERELKRRNVPVITVRGAPDGEGNWSNEISSARLQELRVKRALTDDFLSQACADIGRLLADGTVRVALVDFPGRIDAKAAALLDACTDVLVLTRSRTRAWLEFAGGKHLIACLRSVRPSAHRRLTILPGGTAPWCVPSAEISGLERGLLERTDSLAAALCDLVSWVAVLIAARETAARSTERRAARAGDVFAPKNPAPWRFDRRLTKLYGEPSDREISCQVITLHVDEHGRLQHIQLPEMVLEFARLCVPGDLPVFIDGSMPLWLASALSVTAAGCRPAVGTFDPRMGYVITFSALLQLPLGAVLRPAPDAGLGPEA